MDGFSHCVWLKVCHSNNDLSHVAMFYHFMKSNSHCPIVLYSTCGTEKVTMAAMQCYVRGSGNDDQAGLSVHRYGCS